MVEKNAAARRNATYRARRTAKLSRYEEALREIEAMANFVNPTSVTMMFSQMRDIARQALNG